MTRIWGHFVILVGCECVKLRPQIMLSMFVFPFSACNCNAQGSSSSSCSDTGVCTCNANIGGDKCDACNAGLFNFPTCSGKKY